MVGEFFFKKIIKQSFLYGKEIIDEICTNCVFFFFRCTSWGCTISGMVSWSQSFTLAKGIKWLGWTEFEWIKIWASLAVYTHTLPRPSAN